MHLETKIQEVSNRYSRFMSVALAASLTLGMNVKNKVEDFSQKENIGVVVKDEKKVEDKVEEVVVPEKVEEESKTEKSEEINLNILNIQYSLEENSLAEQFYQAAALDYKAFISKFVDQNSPYKSGKKEPWSALFFNYVESEMISNEEAQEILTETDHATMFGVPHDVSAIKRRKLDLYAKFETAYFGLFMSQLLTRDVNFNSY